MGAGWTWLKNVRQPIVCGACCGLLSVPRVEFTHVTRDDGYLRRERLLVENVSSHILVAAAADLEDDISTMLAFPSDAFAFACAWCRSKCVKMLGRFLSQ
jgi:hypothetical protein